MAGSSASSILEGAHVISNSATWRKFTDINREHAIFELLVDGRVVLDVAYNDEDVFEIAFHEASKNWIRPWESFQRIIQHGRSLADEDRKGGE